ncbi:hypothetical protein BDW22DRAFT_604247 [Trametopsis cervina]|nr:hypothetical protein BDW22DRAFT_604247 [Trametopsis cervina]
MGTGRRAVTQRNATDWLFSTELLVSDIQRMSLFPGNSSDAPLCADFTRGRPTKAVMFATGPYFAKVFPYTRHVEIYALNLQRTIPNLLFHRGGITARKSNIASKPTACCSQHRHTLRPSINAMPVRPPFSSSRVRRSVSSNRPMGDRLGVMTMETKWHNATGQSVLNRTARPRYPATQERFPPCSSVTAQTHRFTRARILRAMAIQVQSGLSPLQAHFEVRNECRTLWPLSYTQLAVYQFSRKDHSQIFRSRMNHC